MLQLKYLLLIIYMKRKKKKFEFIKQQIKKLNKKVIPLILIEIINICFNKDEKDIKKDEDDEDNNNLEEKENKIEEENDLVYFNEMKKFIFNEFSNKLDNEDDIYNIISLLDCLAGKNKNGEKDGILNRKNENDKKKKKLQMNF